MPRTQVKFVNPPPSNTRVVFVQSGQQIGRDSSVDVLGPSATLGTGDDPKRGRVEMFSPVETTPAPDLPRTPHERLEVQIAAVHGEVERAQQIVEVGIQRLEAMRRALAQLEAAEQAEADSVSAAEIGAAWARAIEEGDRPAAPTRIELGGGTPPRARARTFINAPEPPNPAPAAPTGPQSPEEGDPPAAPTRIELGGGTPPRARTIINAPEPPNPAPAAPTGPQSSEEPEPKP